MSAPASAEVRSLYRNLLRHGKKFQVSRAPSCGCIRAGRRQLNDWRLSRSLCCAVSVQDYNIRNYVHRRVRTGFQSNSSAGAPEAQSAYQKGLADLEVVKRQAIISQLYPSQKSVMETE